MPKKSSPRSSPDVVPSPAGSPRPVDMSAPDTTRTIVLPAIMGARNKDELALQMAANQMAYLVGVARPDLADQLAVEALTPQGMLRLADAHQHGAKKVEPNVASIVHAARSMVEALRQVGPLPTVEDGYKPSGERASSDIRPLLVAGTSFPLAIGPAVPSSDPFMEDAVLGGRCLHASAAATMWALGRLADALDLWYRLAQIAPPVSKQGKRKDTSVRVRRAWVERRVDGPAEQARMLSQPKGNVKRAGQLRRAAAKSPRNPGD